MMTIHFHATVDGFTAGEALGLIVSEQVPRLGDIVAVGKNDYRVRRVGWWHWGPNSATLLLEKVTPP